MSVEALKAGAILGVVNRSTFDEQPVSTFAQLDRHQLVADKMIWPCKRLGVPPQFVAQWLRNHAPRLLLGSLTPEGRDELIAIQRMVMLAFGGPDRGAGDPLPRPRFV